MFRKINVTATKINSYESSTLPVIVQFTQQSLHDRDAYELADIGTFGGGNFVFSLEYSDRILNNWDYTFKFYNTEINNPFKDALNAAVSEKSKISSIRRERIFDLYHVFLLNSTYAQNALSLAQYDFNLEIYDSDGYKYRSDTYCVLRSYYDKKIYVLFPKAIINIREAAFTSSTLKCVLTPKILTQNTDNVTANVEESVTVDGITYNNCYVAQLNNYNLLNEETQYSFSVYVNGNKVHKESYRMMICIQDPNENYINSNEYITRQSTLNRDNNKIIMSKFKSTNNDNIDIGVNETNSASYAIIIPYFEIKSNDNIEVSRIVNNPIVKEEIKNNNDQVIGVVPYKSIYTEKKFSDKPNSFVCELIKYYNEPNHKPIVSEVVKEDIDLPIYEYNFIITKNEGDENSTYILDSNKILKENNIFTYDNELDEELYNYLTGKKIDIEEEIVDGKKIKKITQEETEVCYKLFLYDRNTKLQSYTETESNKLISTINTPILFESDFVYYENLTDYNNPNLLYSFYTGLDAGSIVSGRKINFSQKYFNVYNSNIIPNAKTGLLYDNELYYNKLDNNNNFSLSNLTLKKTNSTQSNWYEINTDFQILVKDDADKIKASYDRYMNNALEVEKKWKTLKLKFIMVALKKESLKEETEPSLWITNATNNCEFERSGTNCPFNLYVFKLNNSLPFNIKFYDNNNNLTRTEYNCKPCSEPDDNGDNDNISFSGYKTSDKYYYAEFFMGSENKMIFEFIEENSNKNSIIAYNSLSEVAA